MPNGYAILTVNYSFLLLTLQTWLFSMKYLYSATESSLTPTRLTVKCITKLNWIGSIFFVVSLLSFWCILMATWPGYVSREELSNWFEKNLKVIVLSSSIWFGYNIVGTCITFFGIFSILKTLKYVKKFN